MGAFAACSMALMAAAAVASSLAQATLAQGQEDPLHTRAAAVRRKLALDDDTVGASMDVSTDVTPSVSCSDYVPEITFTVNRLHVRHTEKGERGGCITLSDIYSSRLTEEGVNMGPVYILDEDDKVVNEPEQEFTGRWILTSDLYIEDGITLLVWGTGWGGDADVLRLESNPSNHYNLRGYGGSLSFFHTKVTSWDHDAGMPREYLAKGRSYVSCVSEVLSGETCDGRAKKDRGECRMDIINSEMAYLGFHDSESYGLTWKVRGLCDDLSNVDELFEEVNVYGDIVDSIIHDNYFGVYTYGHQGGIWMNNFVYDNHQYGFDPHDDSDELAIAFNTVHGNGNHGIIASKRCDGATINNNEVYDGDACGIFLHRSSNGAKVYSNFVHDNADAGMAIHESMDNEIYHNTFVRNRVGVRISVGGSDNSIHNNVFDACDARGLDTYEGADSPWVSSGRPCRNIFYQNTLSNTTVGVRFKDGDYNEIYDNVFMDSKLFRFDDSEKIMFDNNAFPTEACSKFEGTSFTSDSNLPASC